MMKNWRQVVGAALGLGLCSAAGASGGDSGTGAVAEMSLSGGQFLMLLGALAVLGVVIWLVAKFLNK